MKPRYKRTGSATTPATTPQWAQPGDGTVARALLAASERGLERISSYSERHTPASSLGDAWDASGRTV